MLSFELQAHLNKHSTRMSDLGFVSGLEDLKKKVAISFTSTTLRVLFWSIHFVVIGSVPWIEFESQSGSFARIFQSL